MALFHDSHVHLADYTQKYMPMGDFLHRAGPDVGRIAAMGMPLQQKWDYFVTGSRAPDYYLATDAALYYYSFGDAVLAMDYLSLPPEDRVRVDPLMAGFNVTDMYSADHIHRVLHTFPGVFSGLGEFSVHKEFVSSKITGHTASLRNPSLDVILDTAGSIGLHCSIHNDISTLQPVTGSADHAADLMELLARHPRTTVIWAHTGLGRFVEPREDHLDVLHRTLTETDLRHVHLDLSWSLVQDYFVEDAGSIKAWADLIGTYPERFLFGTDQLIPNEEYYSSYTNLNPLWELLPEETVRQVCLGTYETLFDEANAAVRGWELMHVGTPDLPSAERGIVLD